MLLHDEDEGWMAYERFLAARLAPALGFAYDERSRKMPDAALVKLLAGTGEEASELRQQFKVKFEIVTNLLIDVIENTVRVDEMADIADEADWERFQRRNRNVARAVRKLDKSGDLPKPAADTLLAVIEARNTLQHHYHELSAARRVVSDYRAVADEATEEQKQAATEAVKLLQRTAAGLSQSAVAVNRFLCFYGPIHERRIERQRQIEKRPELKTADFDTPSLPAQPKPQISQSPAPRDHRPSRTWTGVDPRTQQAPGRVTRDELARRRALREQQAQDSPQAGL